MNIGLDLSFVSGLLQDVFGISTPVYHPEIGDTSDQPGAFSGIQLDPDAPEYDNAPVRFGQKVWGAFWLKGGRYLSYAYDGKLKEEEYSRFLMPLATLVSFSRPKQVKVTQTVGGTGSVKEIYGLGDWAIGINGIILPDYNNPSGMQTVEEQMEVLQQYNEVAGSLSVDGQIFAKREISSIVIESLKFSPIQGKPQMMQYSIQAVSDEDLLLLL